MKLSQEIIKELIYYNPKTGLAYWRNRPLKYFQHCQYPRAQQKSWNTRHSDKCICCRDKKGYLQTTIFNKYYLLHRLIWLYMEGYFPENDIDHKDRNPPNNKWDNLRHTSRSCNIKNQRKRISNTSGITGVYWHKEEFWYSRIYAQNRRINLGSYKNFDDAVKARYRAEIKYEFPNCQTVSTSYQYLKRKNLLDTI